MGRKRKETAPVTAEIQTATVIEEGTGVTVEQHLRNLGLLGNVPEAKPVQPADAAASSQAESAPAAAEVALVRMVRSPDECPAPHTADVHPAEVANYAAHGWKEA